MKDSKFEQARELSTVRVHDLSQVSECSTTTVHSASLFSHRLSTRPASNMSIFTIAVIRGYVVNSTSLSAALINQRP